MPGAKPGQLGQSVQESNYKNNPSFIIVHAGTNSIKTNPRGEIQNKIGVYNELTELGKNLTAKFKGSKIWFSGILFRKGVINREVADINDNVAQMCHDNNFLYVDPNS